MDNGWYRMLRNPKVTLVDDPITEVTEHSRRHRADGNATRPTCW